MTAEHIAIVITALVAAVGSLLAYRSTARKAGLDYLTSVMQTLEDRYKRLSDDFAALSVENAKLREQGNNLQAQVIRLTNELCDVRAENASLLNRMAEQDNKITALEEENVSLRDELEKYRPTRKPKAGA